MGKCHDFEVGQKTVSKAKPWVRYLVTRAGTKTLDVTTLEDGRATGPVFRRVPAEAFLPAPAGQRAMSGNRHDYFLSLARATVRADDDFRHRVADHCVAAEANGENAAIWHAAAQVGGYPERCHCHPCTQARGETK